MYQNKAEDKVITPAHLLLVPTDSSAMSSFISFKNVGLNTLQESSAFSKIRNATKVYNSHLVHTPSSLTNKYHQLNTVFSSEDDFLTTSSFGIKKQHSLSSTSSLGNSFSSSMLDSTSFDKFLVANLSLNAPSSQVNELSPAKASPLSLSKESESSLESADAARLAAFLSNDAAASSAGIKLASYPTLLENINDNSDKAGLQYASTKLSSSSTVKGELLNSSMSFNNSDLDASSSLASSPLSSSRLNESTSSKVYNLSGPNSKVLLAEQSIRSHTDLTPSKSNYNLSSKVNATSSNLQLNKYQNKLMTPLTGSLDSVNNYSDYQLVNKLASARSFISESHPAVNSSNPLLSNSLDYDSTKSRIQSVAYDSDGSLSDSTVANKSAVGDVFVGSREKTPRSINTAY